MTGKLLDDCFLHDKDRLRHAEALAAKDAQLGRFRSELDALLEALKQAVDRRSAEAAAKHDDVARQNLSFASEAFGGAAYDLSDPLIPLPDVSIPDTDPCWAALNARRSEFGTTRDLMDAVPELFTAAGVGLSVAVAPPDMLARLGGGAAGSSAHGAKRPGRRTARRLPPTSARTRSPCTSPRAGPQRMRSGRGHRRRQSAGRPARGSWSAACRASARR